jgi:hypothetical protein
MSETVDGRSLRDRLLGMARQARNEKSHAARRRSVLAIVRVSLAMEGDVGATGVSDIFEEAYGDRSGADYWRSWIDSAERNDALARLLATHVAAEEIAARERPTLDAWAGLTIFGLRRKECEDAVKGTEAGRLQDRLAELNRNLNTQHLVPESLRAFLESSSRAHPASARPKRGDSAPHVTRPRGRRPKQLDRVVKEMRQAIHSGKDIAEWTEASMQTDFKASRDTCRRARDIVLSDGK